MPVVRRQHGSGLVIQRAFGERLQSPDPARGYRRRIVAPGGMQHHNLGRAGQLREVVRRQAEAIFRIVQAKFGPEPPRQERVGWRTMWPHILVEAGQYDPPGRLQAGFQWAPDR